VQGGPVKCKNSDRSLHTVRVIIRAVRR